MLFDTHSHCYYEWLSEKESEVFENMKTFWITKNVQIGTNIETSIASIELAKKYEGTYATVGFHPTDAQEFSENALTSIYEKLDALIEENRDVIVGIGETWFDYYHLIPEQSEEQKRIQELFFEMQCELAKTWNLPLIIHTRLAGEDTLKILKRCKIQKAVFHCYSEDVKYAKACMEAIPEAYFSFSGILTYKKSDAVRETAKFLPLDKILIETDSPFLAPQAVRWSVNEPANVRYVFEELLGIRHEPKDVLEATIYSNSLKFFSIVE